MTKLSYFRTTTYIKKREKIRLCPDSVSKTLLLLTEGSCSLCLFLTFQRLLRLCLFLVCSFWRKLGGLLLNCRGLLLFLSCFFHLPLISCSSDRFLCRRGLQWCICSMLLDSWFAVFLFLLLDNRRFGLLVCSSFFFHCFYYSNTTLISVTITVTGIWLYMAV